MYRSGAFVAGHVEPVTEEQIQPNGVDLTLDSVFEPTDRGRITREDSMIADRRRIDPERDAGGAASYSLPPGGYIVRYREVVHIPADHVGFLYPRSSLMRNGSMVNTAVWDAGYEGRGEGLLQAHHPISIERGARIAQLVLAKGDHTGTYDGAYQGEHTD